VLCILLCYHISATPSPSQLHRDSRVYRSGTPFFLYKAGSVFRTVPHIHILIPQFWHQHHQHFSTFIHHYHHYLCSSPQHVIFFKNSKRAFPAPNFHMLFFISHCSHACCLQLLLSVVGLCVWQDHPPSMSLVNAYSRRDFTQRIGLLFPDSQFFSLFDSIVLFLFVFIM